MNKPEIPTPEIAPRKPIAAALAYGSSAAQVDTAYTYRVERGFPFQRRGQAVVVSSRFNTLRSNTGSGVGLHAPVNQNAITNGSLDPSQPGFLQRGSNVPTFITVAFTFNATSTTALTISWPATPIRRANRQPALNLSYDTAIPAGSISITGLTANTTYFYYPFWSEAAQMLGWGGAGNSNSAGAPAIAQKTQTDAVLQSQSYQGFVPINTLQFTQPAAGTKTTTGGYTAGSAATDVVTGGGRSYRIL